MNGGGNVSHELLSRVAHELRSPLGAILGWAHLLRRRGGDEEYVRGLDVIEHSVQAQVRLIDNLVELSRIGSAQYKPDLEPLEPRSIIDAALASVQGEAAHKQLRISKVLDLAAGPIRGDAGRLKQMMVNLLCNAVRFTPEQGTIDIALKRVEGFAEISVTDSGAGIAPGLLPRIFDQFEDRAVKRGNDGRSEHSGLGLGLAIVRRVVELHGGTIQADNAGEGRGAAFTVRLPLA